MCSVGVGTTAFCFCGEGVAEKQDPDLTRCVLAGSCCAVLTCPSSTAGRDTGPAGIAACAQRVRLRGLTAW